MAKMTVKAARDLALALNTAADAAMEKGEHEFDFLGSAKDAYEAASAELDAAIAEAEKKSA